MLQEDVFLGALISSSGSLCRDCHEFLGVTFQDGVGGETIDVVGEIGSVVPVILNYNQKVDLDDYVRPDCDNPGLVVKDDHTDGEGGIGRVLYGAETGPTEVIMIPIELTLNGD
jgi:hypothetical protein